MIVLPLVPYDFFGRIGLSKYYKTQIRLLQVKLSNH